ncbi:MAG: hypothetical protein LBT23_06555 [Synergistaceae bacterium]|jgi:hypothetical protein|nr:hypothetical protein [Synergistaceae bacterium]
MQKCFQSEKRCREALLKRRRENSPLCERLLNAGALSQGTTYNELINNVLAKFDGRVEYIAFHVCGKLLFLMILWVVYKIFDGSLMGAENSIDLVYRRIIDVILAAVLLFVAYWIWQIMGEVTG